MADRINFLEKINVSVQHGDTLYYTNITGGTGNPIEIGTIIEVGNNFVVVDGPAPIPTPIFVANNLFFMFKKRNLNNAGIKGYFAEARVATTNDSKTELFALSSEITESSK